MTRFLIVLPILCAVIVAGLLLFWARDPAETGTDAGGRFWGGADKLLLACDTSTSDVLVTTLKKALPAAGRLDVQALDAKDSQGRLALMLEGRADIALVRSGLGLEYGTVGAVAHAGVHIVHLVVPADSPLTTFRDLVGHRVGVGAENSDADLLARRVFSYLHFGDPPIVVNDHQADLQSAFAAGEIDAAFLVEPLLSPVVDALLGTGYFRLLAAPEADAIARVLTGVEATTIPPNVYGPERAMPTAAEGRFPALGVNTFLVATPSAPGDALTTLLGLVLAAAPEESLGTTQFTLPDGVMQAGIVTHPVVQRFLHRGAPVTREDLQEFAAMLAGVAFLALGAAQGAILWNRFLERRRRLDMVQWFELVQDIGARMEVADTPQEMGRLVDDMASKQRLIERGWITGKIGATELLLLTQAHQARVIDAIAKHGSPVMEGGAPSRALASFTASFVPEPESVPERADTVVRPDYGEAMIGTVRVRKRETAPAEIVTPEPRPSTRRAEAPEFQEERPAVDPLRSPDTERWAREQPSIIKARTEWARRPVAPQGKAEDSDSDDEDVTVEGDAAERKGRRRGRRGQRAVIEEIAPEHQAPPPPSPPPDATTEDDEQLDLFGRRG